MKNFAKVVLCSAILVTIPVSMSATAGGQFKHQIEARQGYYKMIKFNFGVLGAMVKGKKEYNADTASTAANNIYTLSKLNNEMLWPKGSDNNQAKGTSAKPAIWENFPDVQEKSRNWKSAVKTLASEAGNGLAALRASFGPVGKSCKSCHDDYKAK
ncbi:MAG: cytochrome C554 [Neptuniibacter caesariensis]|uniref:Cytochrome C554 n=1 Tax=Neptuniibacter caesariensis TaxID=207954 RepID=A0A2G6JAG4_NEPCE|nr:MAG: cytochrome C554 [Neptuniibacter caesariensis]